MRKVKEIVLAENFNITTMLGQSLVAGNLAKWCKAMYEYAEAYKIVAPKEKKVADLTDKLKIAEDEVASKKAELAKIKASIR